MGGKTKLARELVPIIQGFVDASDTGVYYEPFCGGCNIIDKILADKRIASDAQRYLIALYQNLDKLSELPISVSREHYNAVRSCWQSGFTDFEDWYIGAIGFLASYNGRFFDGGYAGVVNTASGLVRDYYSEAKCNLEKQAGKLEGVEFLCRDYSELEGISNCVVYCDPPYRGVKQYGVDVNFDSDAFWSWVRELSVDNVVLVSEHEAPSDFECIWEKPVIRTIDNTKRVTAVERLFRKG